MKFDRLAPFGLLLIEPERFRDARGSFRETYNAQGLAAAGFGTPFVQDNCCLSEKSGTVRGLHFQAPPHAQDKLVRVVRGAILDVALDIRKGSPTYGEHIAVELSAANGKQLLVPRGFAHGYCTLEPGTEVFYKVSAHYAPQSEMGILWNDPALGIDWPLAGDAIVAEREMTLPRLADCESPFVFAADPA